MNWQWAPGWHGGLSLAWDVKMWTLLLGATTKCQTGRFCSNKSGVCKIPKMSWTPKQLPLSAICNWATGVYVKSTVPFWVASQRKLLMCLVTPRSASGSTSACHWLWSKETLPAYWPVWKFYLILSVLFLVAWSTDKNRCPPLAEVSMYSYRLPNPRSFCKFHCPSVLQCYFAQWLTILPIAQPMCYVAHRLKPLSHFDLLMITCHY